MVSGFFYFKEYGDFYGVIIDWSTRRRLLFLFYGRTLLAMLMEIV
jgi:hypothetical protein